MFWIVAVIAVPILLATLLSIGKVPPITLAEVVALTFLIWMNCSVIVNYARKLRVGYVTSLFLVPFFVTLPEVVTSTVLAGNGLGLAGFINAIFSVVMDLCFTFALFTVAYYRVCRKVLLEQCPRIELPRAYLAIVTLPPLVTACMYVDWTRMRIVNPPALNDPLDPILLLVAYCLILAVPCVLYLLKHRHEIVETVITAEQEVGFVASWYDAVILVLSLVSLFFLSYQFAERMDIVCTVLGQKAGGILSAYLTSIPDAMYSLAAFSPRLDEVKESLVELWGSATHDMTRNIGFPALLYAYHITILGVTGGPVIGNPPTILAMWIAVLTWALTHAIAGKREHKLVATTKTATILLTVFAVCTAIGLLF